MLSILENLPEGILGLDAKDLYRVLDGPTLIHLEGRRPEPLFVSVLLHGNEDTGWQAMREILARYAGQELPRALSLFIGNIGAAREGKRFLEGQPDYNRIWEDVPGNEHLPERKMVQQVVDTMRERRVFASVDVHNNTGMNPHYACVRELEHHHLHLATLFSRTVVYFRTPAGVQTAPFASICPAVTIEAGQAGQTHGLDHTREFLEACLHLSQLPDHEVAGHDIDLYHTVAVCKIPPNVTFGFGNEQCELNFIEDLDHLNFRELPVGTTLAKSLKPELGIVVRNEGGEEITQRYFEVSDGELRTTAPFMPSMLAADETAIRQDCLCYLMERYPGIPVSG
jgi:succinylglutamate desuccinylase